MIYLDYSATTPLDPAVLKKMQPYFSRQFANPASVHTPGQAALKAVDDARYTIADLLGVKGSELIFTSGATEANNLCLKGMAQVHEKNLKNLHLITTKIEHDSILEPCHALEERGLRITYLPVDDQGLVNPQAVIEAITPQTFLVSIGYVNSEIGTVQPVKKIGRLISKHNERRYKDWLNTSPRKRGVKPRKVYFHTDATQAAQFFDCRPDALHIDALSLSGHKIYGPKGIGLLYLRTDTPCEAIQQGGHQERNMRSGTVNVPGVIGLAEACRLAAKDHEKNLRASSVLRDRLAQGIKKVCLDAIINTPLPQAGPSHLNISFPGIEGDALLMALDEKGVAVSTGSACASGDIDASHVLTAMGRTEELSRSAIRFTIGKYTTGAEIKKVVAVLPKILQALKKYSHTA